jgi:uncharacterized membrane protein (DUF2068 family)
LTDTAICPALHARELFTTTEELTLSTDMSSGKGRALRAIALFEASKGLAALVIGIGLAQLLHHDLHQLVLELVGHFGLDLNQPFPALLLHYADVLNTTPLDTVELLLGGYLSLRFVEAYGLWMARAWAEWLGALSGGLYIPFELHHFWHEPGVLSFLVTAINVLIVAFLVMQLRQRQATAVLRTGAPVDQA